MLSTIATIAASGRSGSDAFRKAALRAADVAATSAGGSGGNDDRRLRGGRFDFGARELGGPPDLDEPPPDETSDELGELKSGGFTELILARCAKRMTRRDGRFALSPCAGRETWVCCHAKARSHFWIR
jgi:hypothetical protein